MANFKTINFVSRRVKWDLIEIGQEGANHLGDGCC